MLMQNYFCSFMYMVRNTYTKSKRDSVSLNSQSLQLFEKSFILFVVFICVQEPFSDVNLRMFDWLFAYIEFEEWFFRFFSIIRQIQCYVRKNWKHINLYATSLLFSNFSMDYIGLGCCALAFALYLNTLDAGFVYDDR